MKTLTIFSGILMTLMGVFSIVSAGLSFLALAFPIGIVLMVVGLVLCFAYKRIAEDEENSHWVLIEGLTMFMLGFVVLTGQLAADIAVPVVFGLWSMISGIRGFAVLSTWDMEVREKNIDFFWSIIVSILNLVVGIYAFFNSMLLGLSVLMYMGISFVVQGANVIKIGADITYSKPDLIKSKDELVADAQEAAKAAKKEMKKAIKNARKAKNAVKEAEESKDVLDIIAEAVGETKDSEPEKEE